MKQIHPRRGFTLIELLVVVLIIGILAAIAVPQYQVAVGKSQLIQGISLCESLERAQKVYFLANGNYSHKLTDLDIEMPSGGTLNTAKDSIEYPNFKLTMEGQKNNDWYCGINSKQRKIHYYQYWAASGAEVTTRKDCRAADRDNVANSICKSLGGAYSGSYGTEEKFNVYYL